MPLRLIEGQYSPGDPFCMDLATSDVEGAAEFYGRVFGWEFEGSGSQLKALKSGRLAAGIGLMEPLDLRAHKWWVCLASADTAAGAKKAEKLGASVARPAEVEGLGPVALVRDTGGADFALWQPKNISPGALGAAHGGIVWAELLTKDPAAVAPFYEEMFGAEAVPVGGSADSKAPKGALSLVRSDIGVKRAMSGIVPLGGFTEEAIGERASGPLDDSGQGGQAMSHDEPRWRAYLMVEDTQVFLDEAKAAGARVIESRVSASRQAVTVLEDPQGVEFAVVEGTGSTQS